MASVEMITIGSVNLTASPDDGFILVRVDCNRGYTYIQVSDAEWRSWVDASELPAKVDRTVLELVKACESRDAAIAMHKVATERNGMLREWVRTLERERNEARASNVLLAARIRELEAKRAEARTAAKVYAARVDDLGLAADDDDPAVMATAEPIGAAQADLYAALGIYLCDFRHDHDEVTDRPMGEMCGKDATHVITWEDGRHSFGCADHLEIDAAATVKPLSIVPIGETGVFCG